MSNEIFNSSNNIQIKILETLKSVSDKGMSLKGLEDILGLKEVEIETAVSELENCGIKFDKHDNYKLVELPDAFLAPILMMGLKTKKFGHNAQTYKSIGSTNEVAKRLIESKVPDGTIVVADRQTKGRGRFGRSWLSPPKSGIYLSIVLYPTLNFEKMPALSMVAALAVCRVIQKYTGLNSQVKWPNDCLLNGKKISGILVESSVESGKISGAVLGVGINVNLQKKDLPLKLRSKATSLAIETGKQFNRINILKDLLLEIEKSYNSFTKYGLRFIGRELTKRSAVLNNKISYQIGRKKHNGIAIGFDENGALRVKSGKEVLILSAGEVTLRK